MESCITGLCIPSKNRIHFFVIEKPTYNNTFKHNFYNLVDPKQVNLYGRPPNATNDAVWQKAVQENPDPSWCVFV